MMLRLRNRVVLYIVHERRILLMDHVDHPDVPTQFPGGTIESGELPEEAALREGIEETGLVDLSIKSMLGTVCLGQDHLNVNRAGDRVILQAWYFQLELHSPGPDSWRHSEQFASEADAPVRLQLYWSAPQRWQHLKQSDSLLLGRLQLS